MNEVIEMNEPAIQVPQHRSAAVAPTTPASLLQIAVQRGASMVELTALMDLQDRYEANQARKAYVEAMAAFKKNAPEIYKDKNVSFTGTSYSHATLGGICEVVIASLASHGLSHRWDTHQPGNGMIVVKCILTHSLGHSESTQLEAPPDNSGKKNGIQQLASTVTYLQRYTLLAATGLATKDIVDDDGAAAEERPEPKQRAKTPMLPERFKGAIEAVRTGKYQAEYVRRDFILTVDQETALSDAEKEAK